MDLAMSKPEAIAHRATPTIWSGVALYCGTGLLSIIIVIASLSLWRADLRVPFDYRPDGHDAFVNMMLAKTVIETGWTWHNPNLGAPGRLDLLDFRFPNRFTMRRSFVCHFSPMISACYSIFISCWRFRLLQ